MNIEIINSRKFIEISDFVFSAVVSEQEFYKNHAKDSTIIEKSNLGNSNFIWFIKDKIKIKDNDIVFCHFEAVEHLFKIIRLSNLKNIILISSQSDLTLNKSVYLKKPESIKVWYSTNVNLDKPDLRPIPIGINNEYIEIYPCESDFKKFKFKDSNDKKDLIYSNFNINTRFFHRYFTDKFSKNKDFIIIEKADLDKQAYLETINDYKFILSPWGNGIDTHRIWEAIYANCVPIVQDHNVLSKFKELPIIFVKSFQNINSINFIESNHSKSMEMADFKYWKKEIFNERKEQTIINSEFVSSIEKLNQLYLKKKRRIRKIQRFKKKIKYITFRVFKKIF